MKKLLFLAMAVLAICFIGCTHSDSKKVDPSIIGTTYLQYDSESNCCYAVIGSTQYPVHEVLIPSKNGYNPLKTSQIAYVEDVNITLFTSPHFKGVQAVVGRQNEAMIKENCEAQINFYIILIIGLAFVLAIVGLAIYEAW